MGGWGENLERLIHPNRCGKYKKKQKNYEAAIYISPHRYNASSENDINWISEMPEKDFRFLLLKRTTDYVKHRNSR